MASQRFEQKLADSAALRDEDPTQELLKDRLTRIQDALGGALGVRGNEDTFTEAELRLAGQWIKARRLAERGSWYAQNALERLDERLGAAEEALHAFRRLEESMSELLEES